MSGKVARWIKLQEPAKPTAPGSHPTAMLLSPDEKLLYIALSNADAVAAVSTDDGQMVALFSTIVRNQEYSGTYPIALAQSEDGKRVFAADGSSNAVAVFDTSHLITNIPHSHAENAQVALGFIPTDWYPSALAVHGDELLIATAKGQGARPNPAWARRLGRSNITSIPTFLRFCMDQLPG